MFETKGQHPQHASLQTDYDNGIAKPDVARGKNIENRWLENRSKRQDKRGKYY